MQHARLTGGAAEEGKLGRIKGSAGAAREVRKQQRRYIAKKDFQRTRLQPPGVIRSLESAAAGHVDQPHLFGAGMFLDIRRQHARMTGVPAGSAAGDVDDDGLALVIIRHLRPDTDRQAHQRGCHRSCQQQLSAIRLHDFPSFYIVQDIKPASNP